MQLFKNKGYPLNKQAEDLIYKLVRNNITFGFKLQETIALQPLDLSFKFK